MFKQLFDYWKVIGLFTKYWPKVRSVVEYVERFNSAATSEEKKIIAKQMLQNDLPAPPTWCDEDWDTFIGGLIDAIVALLNWRGIFKHRPSHPCSKK